MSWTDLAFTVTTPMFLGRGDTQGDGFRVPELRGALRFWFRALAAERVGNDLALLAALEGSVFGAATGGRGRPSAVRLRVKDAPDPTDTLAPPWLRQPPRQQRRAGNGLGYLLGPGLFKPRGRGEPDRVLRPYLEPDPQAQGLVQVDPGPYGDLVACCLWAVATRGGLGARVRRGFGGIQFDPAGLQALLPGVGTALQLPSSREALTAVQGLFAAALDHHFPKQLQGRSQPEPPARASYPQLSKRWYVSSISRGSWSSWHEALHVLGDAFRAHRTPRERPEQERAFKRYVTAEYQDIVTKRPPRDPPDFPLAAFGLPIGFKASWVEVDGMRRASPLWMRPVQVGAGEWRLHYQVFRSTFLPDDARLRLRRGGGPAAPLHIDDRLVEHTLLAWLKTAP
jgi:CRISPR-associated protein Cmr1